MAQQETPAVPEGRGGGHAAAPGAGPYDLYAALGLDRATPTPALHAQLSELIEKRSAAHDLTDPLLHELSTARAVLGDATRRHRYDVRLDAGDPSLTVADIIELAGTPVGRPRSVLTAVTAHGAVAVICLLCCAYMALAARGARADMASISFNSLGAATVYLWYLAHAGCAAVVALQSIAAAVSAHRGRNWWRTTTATVVSMLLVIAFTGGSVVGRLAVLVLVLQVVAVAALLLPTSHTWFGTRDEPRLQ